MVIKMSKKTLEQMFSETKAASVAVGNHIESRVDRKTAEIQETAVKVGRHIEARVDRRTAEIQDTTAKVGRHIEARSDRNHGETRNVIRDEADGTRRVIRDESDRLSKSLRDNMEWPEILIGLLFGIIAGIGMWFAEKGVIIKPVQWDAAGNVLKYGPDTFLVIVLSVVLGVFVFFFVSWIVHAIRSHTR
jgi:hypothetical protein